MQLWVSPSGKKIDAPDSHVETLLLKPKLFGPRIVDEIERLKEKFGGIPDDDDDRAIEFDSAILDLSNQLLRSGWFTLSTEWKSGVTIFAFKYDDKVKREILSTLVDLKFDGNTPLKIVYGAFGRYIGTVESALKSALQEQRFRRLVEKSLLEWKPKGERIDFDGEIGSFIKTGSDYIIGNYDLFKLPNGGFVRIYDHDEGYECFDSSMRFHRTDGPARNVREDIFLGGKEYWVHGRHFTEEEFKKHFGDE